MNRDALRVRTSVVIVWSLALVSVPQRAVRAATDADLASQRAAAIRELGIVHATTLAAGQTDWNIVPVEHLTVETVVGLRFIEGGARTTLSQISLFPNLKVLDLRQDRPSDGELRSISRLKHLEELDLEGLEVTDSSLRHLAHLHELKTLRLTLTGVTGTGFRSLAPCKQIRNLEIGLLELAAGALASLKQFPVLEELDLSASWFPGGDLRYVASIRGLRRLRLVLTPRINDRAIATLAPLVRLQLLDISGTDVTDASVRDIVALRSLTKLVARGTRLTAEGVRAIMLRRKGIEVITAPAEPSAAEASAKATDKQRGGQEDEAAATQRNNAQYGQDCCWPAGGWQWQADLKPRSQRRQVRWRHRCRLQSAPP